MADARRSAQRAPLTAVVLATDFSPGARAAVERVARLPLAPGARVSLLHVQPGDLSRPARRAAGAFARHRLERLAETLSDRLAGVAGVRVTGALAWGRPFVEIIRHARRRGAELVVLGRHGRRPIRDLLIGSTAERAVRYGGVPVLVVNREPTGPYRRPLAATDLEPASLHAAALGARLVDPAVRTIVAVHAWEVPFEGWIALSEHADGRRQYRRSHREEAAGRFKRLLTGLDAGFRWQGVLRRGDPRAVVLHEAKRRRADLLMLGSHGRAGLARALLGTVTEAVVAEATCDVLVARPPGLVVELP
jgi:nucleotide-binding universal stress UspA family protein